MILIKNGTINTITNGIFVGDILVDGKFVEELKDNNLHWKGSSNQNVIDVKKSLRTGELIIYG